MAFVKTKELPSGISGDYWRIIQVSTHQDRDDHVVQLQLYLSQAGREFGNQPLSETVQFNFAPGDHPLSELNEESVDTALVTNTPLIDWWYKRFCLHCLYLHIRAVSLAAKAKDDANAGLPPEEQVALSANEQLALFFWDAADVF